MYKKVKKKKLFYPGSCCLQENQSTDVPLLISLELEKQYSYCENTKSNFENYFLCFSEFAPANFKTILKSTRKR